MLMWAKEYLAQEYPSFIRPRLEADDCMGILATNSKLLGSSYEGDQIIMCSEDKDMRTIPGFLYNPNQPQLGVISISEEDANRFHMWQTLTGDQTDGYPGCPGIGPKSDYVGCTPPSTSSPHPVALQLQLQEQEDQALAAVLDVSSLPLSKSLI
jgi:DNA polymerase-1